MTTRPEGEASESETIKTFRGQGWYNIWGVLLAIFIGLVCACAYWIARLGVWGALSNPQFGFEAFLAFLVGICLLARWTIPYALLTAGSIDPRTADMARSYWTRSCRLLRRGKRRPGAD
jgi:hypothetical protein